MNGLLAGCIALGLIAFAELLFPGQAVYQYGWFNALLVAAFVICAVRARQVAREKVAPALALLTVVVGTGVFVIAAVANGLFAPDPQTIIGSPGASVHVADLRGSLVFPLAVTDTVVRLDRGGSITEIPASGLHFAAAFALSQAPRTVLAVDVADPRGAHLTVTQPNGGAFLSPVLTLPSQQNVAGMNLPFDSFAVPAAHRIVKVVLFDARHAEMLKAIDTHGRGAALFAVDDENDKPVARGLGLAIDGESTDLGGLRLKAVAMQYPAVRIAAVPVPLVLALGALLLLAGGIWCRLRKL